MSPETLKHSIYIILQYFLLISRNFYLHLVVLNGGCQIKYYKELGLIKIELIAQSLNELKIIFGTQFVTEQGFVCLSQVLDLVF